MPRLLIRNADAIVSCDSQDHVYENCSLLIENGVIAGIGPEPQEAEEVIDASGCIVYPGLVNTHHHLYQTFSRNLPAVQNLELFDWLKALYEIWKNLDREVIYHSALTGLGELLKSGCTTCFDHHYVFPQGRSEGLLEAQQLNVGRQLVQAGQLVEVPGVIVQQGDIDVLNLLPVSGCARIGHSSFCNVIRQPKLPHAPAPPSLPAPSPRPGSPGPPS